MTIHFRSQGENIGKVHAHTANTPIIHDLQLILMD